jgi:hypothetical protein
MSAQGDFVMGSYEVLGSLALAAGLLWGLSMTSRMRRLEKRLDDIAAHLGVYPVVLQEPSAEIRLMALDPTRYIEAIREYRRQTGADLRSARATIDGIRKAAGASV